MVALGGCLYVMGGSGAAGDDKALTSVERFNPLQGQLESQIGSCAVN